MEKRTIKPKNPLKTPDFRKLNSASVLCPICRTILVEPVSLPCQHAFCRVCFEGSMQNTNLVCPLCRLRVASWLRKSSKEGALVNKTFWQAIQDQFPKEVQNKLAGIDNDIEKEEPRIVVANPGEIRKEYEKERQKALEEHRQSKEDEEKASSSLIKKLQEEEEYKVQVEEEKLKCDLLLARKLSLELNSPSTSKSTPRKRKGHELGPMDRYLLANQVTSPKNKLLMKKPIELHKINALNPKKRIQTSTITSDRSCKRQKRDTISPVLSKNYFGKQYTCQVFSVEQNPVRTSLSTNIFADLDVKGILGNLGQKPTKLIESERRKDVCLSGYKSTESSSDVIDQECKFYFKPIEVHRKHHVGGRIPVKVAAVRGRPNQNPTILKPRTKKIVTVGSPGSAFARFSSLSLVHSRPTSTAVIEAEEDLKIKVPYVNKVLLSEKITPKEKVPCGDLDKARLRLVIKSPFYGFDTLQIAESIKQRQDVDKIITKLQSLMFTTVTSLKVGQIIENQIVELQRSIERREARKKREKCRDINRNLSEINSDNVGNKGIKDGEGSVSVKRKSTDVNSSILKDATLKSVKLNGSNESTISPDLFNDNVESLEQVGVDHGGIKTDQKVLNNTSEVVVNKHPDTLQQKYDPVYSDIPTQNLNSKFIKENGVNKCLLEQKRDPVQLDRPTPDILNGDFEETLSSTSQKINTDKNMLNEANSSLAVDELIKNSKYLKKELTIATTDVFESSSEDEDFSKLIDSICNSKDSANEDTQSPNLTFIAQKGGEIAKNGVKRNNNRKITDSFSKVKISPTKGKKGCGSPRKYKGTSTTEGYDESQVEEQKKSQEERDFALAQKLQAEFDLLQVASRTRRGTKRQVTLDELLTA